MHSHVLKSVIAVCVLAGLLAASTGCCGALVCDVNLPTFVGGTLFGVLLDNLLGGQTTITVERFCYENGVLVDCDQLPAE